MNNKGQGLVEYALILGVVGVVGVALLALVGPALNGVKLAPDVAQAMENSSQGSMAQEFAQSIQEFEVEELTEEESAGMASFFTANAHAIAGHEEAVEIQECLRNNGPMRLWRDRYTKDLYALCQLPNGLWGMMVCTADGLRSKTAYIPKDGTWAKLLEYLGNKGTPAKLKIPLKCD